MVIQRWFLVGLLVQVLGCRTGTTSTAAEPQSPDSVQTGLKGTAYTGPTRPVCLVARPCNAPFTGNLVVRQAGQVAARFQSDSAGNFLVYLAPGAYAVALDEPASPLLRSQVHEVTVGSSGLTHVELEFDTGIR